MLKAKLVDATGPEATLLKSTVGREVRAFAVELVLWKCPGLAEFLGSGRCRDGVLPGRLAFPF
jgi:hypothetical protein